MDINETIKKATSKSDFTNMISKIKHSQLQAQTFHRQTKLFPEHIALGEYYETIVDITDELVETYQGKNGILTNYESYELENYENSQQVIKYFEELVSIVSKLRKNITESYIQNQIDNVEQLIYKTLYKLKYLK
jgi:hypothetical protein